MEHPRCFEFIAAFSQSKKTMFNCNFDCQPNKSMIYFLIKSGLDLLDFVLALTIISSLQMKINLISGYRTMQNDREQSDVWKVPGRQWKKWTRALLSAGRHPVHSLCESLSLLENLKPPNSPVENLHFASSRRPPNWNSFLALKSACMTSAYRRDHLPKDKLRNPEESLGEPANERPNA